ncbi:hypothetical protein [Sinorhizobium fredii]|uniref:hypothetical protein n=1 Tax=Rhizobium fredii TaxID=380 RepID=UPI0012980CA8|nr:hypothetical protein [Sinorhizobium fredii]MQW99616.1 hypothetical protein [Sinorhizobium fredii]
MLLRNFEENRLHAGEGPSDGQSEIYAFDEFPERLPLLDLRQFDLLNAKESELDIRIAAVIDRLEGSWFSARPAAATRR